MINYYAKVAVLVPDESDDKVLIDIWKSLGTKRFNYIGKTLGVSISTLEIPFNEDNILYTIWYLSPEKRFDFLKTDFLMGASLGILLYDSSRKDKAYVDKVSSLATLLKENLSVNSKIEFNTQNSLKEEVKCLTGKFKRYMQDIIPQVVSQELPQRSLITEDKNIEEIVQNFEDVESDNTPVDIVTPNGVVTDDSELRAAQLYFEDMTISDVTKVVVDLFKNIEKGIEVHIKPVNGSYIVTATYNKEKNKSKSIRGSSDF